MGTFWYHNSAVPVPEVIQSGHSMSWRILPTPSSSILWLPCRARSPIGVIFHDAYFRSRDGKTSLMGGLGRTGKQFGPETWVQRDPRRSERPTKRPKQLVHGPRGRAPSYSVASAPQRAPPKMNENENLPLLGSTYTNRRKAATVSKGQTSLGGDWTTTARGCCGGRRNSMEWN
jgi:hypothetical protein